MVATSLSSSLMKFLLYPLNAEGLLATKVPPSPTPMHSGDPWEVTADSSGRSEHVTTSPPRTPALLHGLLGGHAKVRPAVLVVVSDQLGYHLRVGLSLKLVPHPLQLLPQFCLVEEAAVVTHGDPAGGVDVQVRVLVGNGPVDRPAGVGDADGVAEDGAGGVSRGFY